MAIFVPRFVRQLRDVLLTAPADGEVLTYDSADEKWKNEAGGGGGGDLTDAVILAPASSARNVIQPTAGAVIAAIVKAHAAQSVDLTQWQLSDGTVLGSVGPTGLVTISPSSAQGLTDFPLKIVPPADILTGSYIPFVVDRVGGGGDGSSYLFTVEADGTVYIHATPGEGSGQAGFYLQDDAPGVTRYRNGDIANATFSHISWSGVAAELAVFGSTPVVQQTAATIGDLWTALKLYGWLDAGSVAPSVGGAPTGATYITQTPDGGLSAEQALSALATGLVKNTTGTGVLSIAVAGTDYASQASVDEKVAKSLYDANTVLAADSDDTPAALTMGASTILARLAAGNIKAATPAELRTLLALVVGTDVQAFDSDLAAIAALADPNADRILFWDDSAGAYTFLTPGTGLTITGTTIDAAAGGGVAHARKTGSYYTVIPSTGDGTLIAVLNNVYYIPFPVYVAHTIDKISLGVSTVGGAGSVVRLGIYNSDANGQPSSLLLDAGTIDGTSATYQEKTISQALSANTLYWAAVVSQVGTAPVVRALAAGNGSEWVALATNSADPRVSNYFQAGVTGALGAATPAAGSTINPAVKVRIA